jgi:hypothetical protein
VYKYKCSECKNIFHSHNVAKRHVARIHKNVNIKCLRVHVMEKSSTNQCHLCFKYLSSEYRLKVHFKRQHGEKKICRLSDVCGN